MNELPSTEFRKRFARLADVTVVTANGHPIGVWTPTQVVTMPTPKDIRPVLQASTQTQRDELLRKINKR